MIALAVLLLLAQSKPPISKTAEVMRWTSVAGPAECKALAGALADPSYDIRYRAASALYWKCDRKQAAGDAGKSLCSAVDRQIGEAGAILLLGYADARPQCLDGVAGKKGYLVTLAGTGGSVPAVLAARVASARFGTPEAVAALRADFEQPSTAVALFLLRALPDIDDRECLRATLKLLQDRRRAPGLTSAGSRTIADVAIDSLASKFKLQIRDPGELTRKVQAILDGNRSQ